MNWIDDLRDSGQCDDVGQLRNLINREIEKAYLKGMTTDSVENLMATCKLVKDSVETFVTSTDPDTQQFLRDLLKKYDLPSTLKLCKHYSKRPK